MNSLPSHHLRVYFLIVFCVLITSCVAPALLLSPQSQIMWALLKPMVGLDPKEANLFKQPVIQSRLEPLLGSRYSSAIQLLETADKIQQEGPLFYVVSKYTPVPELAEKAGFVWNSDTNQMAVLLVSGGAPQVFAEKLNSEIAQQVPVWPAELSDYTDPAKLKQQALSKAEAQIAEQLPIPSAIAPAVATAQQIRDLPGQAEKILEDKKQQVVEQALSPVSTVQQQAEQQLKQVEDQVKKPLISPVKEAQQQLLQAGEKTKAEITAPAAAIKQQTSQKIQGALAPIAAVSQQASEGQQAAVQQLQQAANIQQPSAADPTAVTIDPKQTAASTVEQPVISDAADDIAAELAEEQQALSAKRSKTISSIELEITQTTQQIKQTSEPAKLIELQQKLQKLKDKLQQLKTSD